MSYLKLPDDPPIPGEGGVRPIDLEKYIKKEKLDALKRRMRVLPRQSFEEVIEKVLPEIKTQERTIIDPVTGVRTTISEPSGTGGIMFYANFLHLFNLVNEDEMKRRGLDDPWKWEEEKMRALYIKQAMGEI